MSDLNLERTSPFVLTSLFSNLRSYIRNNDRFRRFYQKHLLAKRLRWTEKLAREKDLNSSVYKVLIEVSSLCNLRCAHCYRENFEYGSKNVNMDLATFKLIVDQLDPYATIGGTCIQRLLDMHGVGEPSLNRDIVEMVRYASESGFRTIIGTNLTARRLSRYQELMEAGLERMVVSIDSLSKSLIPLTRVGTNLPRLVENLRGLAVDYADRIIVRTVVSRINLRDLEKIQHFLESCGITKWGLQPLQDFENNSFGIDQSVVDDLNEKIPGLPAMHSNLQKNQSLERPTTCRVPRTTLTINAVGDLMPCHQYWDGDVVNFGNIKDGSIEELFASETFSKFRRQLFSSKKVPKVCVGCLFR